MKVATAVSLTVNEAAYSRLMDALEPYGVREYCEANLVCRLTIITGKGYIVPMFWFSVAFTDENGDVSYYDPTINGYAKVPGYEQDKIVSSSYPGHQQLFSNDDSIGIQQIPEFEERGRREYENSFS